MEDINLDNEQQTQEVPQNSVENSQVIPEKPKKKCSPKKIFLYVLIILVLVCGGLFWYYMKVMEHNKIMDDMNNMPVTINKETVQETNKKLPQVSIVDELAYEDPCETGDERGCIMEEAYSKIKLPGSLSDKVFNVWSESFKVCDKYPNDTEILYDVDQCKIDVCTNIYNLIEYLSPDSGYEEQCISEVMPVCPDGNIIDNVPCTCNVPAGPQAAYSQYWLETFWNVNKTSEDAIYCCSGAQQDMPCN